MVFKHHRIEEVFINAQLWTIHVHIDAFSFFRDDILLSRLFIVYKLWRRCFGFAVFIKGNLKHLVVYLVKTLKNTNRYIEHIFWQGFIIVVIVIVMSVC